MNSRTYTYMHACVHGAHPQALLQNHRALVSLLDESQRSSVVSYGIAIEKETREALGRMQISMFCR